PSDTLDMGAPLTRTRATRQRVLGMLRWYAGMAVSIHGETIENSLPGEYFSYTLKEPIGVVAPAMSVFTTIGAMPAGSSTNEIDAALAGPAPAKETIVRP